MKDDLLTDWQEDVMLSSDQWDKARESAARKLGINELGPRFIGNANTFPNWIRLAPNDGVQRLRDSDDRSAELINIAREIYDRHEPQSPPFILQPLDSLKPVNEDAVEGDMDGEKAGQLWHLTEQVVAKYSGTVDFDRLNNDRPLEYRAQDVEAPAGGVTVFIHRWNERNMQDIAVFSVDNGQEFFGEAFGDRTLMFKRLRQSQKQPEYVATDVAFDTCRYSWGNTNPPDHPISVMSKDNKNRVDFYDIPKPTKSCEDTWGDVSAIMSGLSDDESVHAYSCKVGWAVALGI